jgi:hypothetical protein
VFAIVSGRHLVLFSCVEDFGAPFKKSQDRHCRYAVAHFGGRDDSGIHARLPAIEVDDQLDRDFHPLLA